MSQSLQDIRPFSQSCTLDFKHISCTEQNVISYLMSWTPAGALLSAYIPTETAHGEGGGKKHLGENYYSHNLTDFHVISQ